MRISVSTLHIASIAAVVMAAGPALARFNPTQDIRPATTNDQPHVSSNEHVFQQALPQNRLPVPSNETRPTARRAMCGTDLGKPRVGMRLKRAQECVGNLKLVKELKRNDGFVEIYNAGPTYLTVKNDHIVAFSSTE